MKSSCLKLGIVLFNDFDQLDVTGPFEVFYEFPKTKVYFIAHSLEPVSSVQGIKLTPEFTFNSAPKLDILFVPGGYGVMNALETNSSLINFIKKQSAHLKYLSSFCTGSLILGYAGELKGYKATSHWLAKKYLPKFGAIPVNERVVVDRNRVTGSGVSAGFDVALHLGEILFGKAFVETQILLSEYHPKPLYDEVLYETVSQEARDMLDKKMNPIITNRDLFFEKYLEDLDK